MQRVKASDKVREKTRKLVSFADDLPKETSAPTMADAKLNARQALCHGSRAFGGELGQNSLAIGA